MIATIGLMSIGPSGGMMRRNGSSTGSVTRRNTLFTCSTTDPGDTGNHDSTRRTMIAMMYRLSSEHRMPTVLRRGQPSYSL